MHLSFRILQEGKLNYYALSRMQGLFGRKSLYRYSSYGKALPSPPEDTGRKKIASKKAERSNSIRLDISFSFKQFFSVDFRDTHATLATTNRQKISELFIARKVSIKICHSFDTVRAPSAIGSYARYRPKTDECTKNHE